MNDNKKIYGVLKTRVEIDNGEYISHKSGMSHYNLITKLGSDMEYQVNIDIQSDKNKPNVHIYYVQNYQNELIKQFDSIQDGFTALSSQASGLALDYLRNNLFPIENLSQASPMSAEQIAAILDQYLEDHEFVVAFGNMYSADSVLSDTHYGKTRYNQNNSLPPRGVDCVHLNQGSSGHYVSENGIYQDGALFVKATDGTYAAFFFAFDEQCYNTDNSGNCT
jgi:uncharacterized protein YukJ